MPRICGGLNADLHALLPAVRAAGFKDYGFGTIAWDEAAADGPAKHIVQVARRFNGKGFPSAMTAALIRTVWQGL